jgi:hypothetical protein
MTVFYVDGDNGNDSNDGSTEALAKATIQAAVNAVTADRDVVYIQNNGSTVYTEQVTLPAYGVYLIGYGTTIGDNVRAVIDGEDTRTYCIYQSTSDELFLYNMEIRNATSHGLSTVGAGKLFNVHAHDNGGDGHRVTTGNEHQAWFFCTFNDNGGNGLYNLNGNAIPSPVWYCDFYNNTGHGVFGYILIAYRCRYVKNNTGAYIISGNGFQIQCIFDSNAQHGAYGYYTHYCDCISSNNGSYGYATWATPSYVHLVNCNDYQNVSGRNNRSVAEDLDINPVSTNPDFIAPYSVTNTDLADLDYHVGASSDCADYASYIGCLNTNAAAKTMHDLGAQDRQDPTVGVNRSLGRYNRFGVFP